MTKKWYEASMGNHQGLIIDEKTGKNIAVAYDKANAPLISAAPELLEAVKLFLEEYDVPGRGNRPEIEAGRRALEKCLV